MRPIVQPRAARFQIYSATPLIAPPSEEDSKKKERERVKEGEEEEEERKPGRGGEDAERETEERRFVPFGSVRRRLTQRGYRGRLDGHIEGARST